MLKRACFVLVYAAMAGGCASKPLHPAARQRGVKPIDVYYDENSSGRCVPYIGGPQTVVKRNKDSLRVSLHNFCRGGSVTVRLAAASLPLDCTPALGQSIPVALKEAVDCSVRYSKEQYGIKVTDTSAAGPEELDAKLLGSELALDEYP